MPLVIHPRVDLEALAQHYDELDRLIDRALAAIQEGDRARAILLSSAIVQKTHALDRRLRRLGLLPEGT